MSVVEMWVCEVCRCQWLEMWVGVSSVDVSGRDVGG